MNYKTTLIITLVLFLTSGQPLLPTFTVRFEAWCTTRSIGRFRTPW